MKFLRDKGWHEIAAWQLSIALVFLLVNFIHFRTFEVSVILYACMLDQAIASALILLAYAFVFRHRSTISPKERILSIISANLLLLVYAIMGPTVMDRSLSLYIVQKLDQRGGQISEVAMPIIINKEFMQEYKVADVRLTEQIASGTAKIERGCIILTPKGRALAAFVRFFRKHMLPQKRSIKGSTMDNLTDPLSHSPVIVPYKCPE